MDITNNYIVDLKGKIDLNGVYCITADEAKFHDEKYKSLNDYFSKTLKLNRRAFTKRRKKIDEFLKEDASLGSLSKEFIYYKKNELELLNIRKVSSFMEEISELGSHKKILYRGQGDINWSFNAGLFRQDIWVKNEKDMFYEMLIRKPNEFKDCKNDFERLVKMQHYGLPTRLIDLTPNPLIAIYFACLEKDVNGQIFLLEIEDGDIKHFESEEVENISIKKDRYLNDQESYMIIRARHNNERIIKQEGLFVLADKDYKNFSFFKRNNKVLRFIVLKKYKFKILKELELMGIHEGTLFPEMEKFTKYLRDVRYK